jgi:hypothetical protein
VHLLSATRPEADFARSLRDVSLVPRRDIVPPITPHDSSECANSKVSRGFSHPSVLTGLFDGFSDRDLRCSLGARFRHIKVVIRRFRPVAAASHAYQVE